MTPQMLLIVVAVAVPAAVTLALLRWPTPALAGLGFLMMTAGGYVAALAPPAVENLPAVALIVSGVLAAGMAGGLAALRRLVAGRIR